MIVFTACTPEPPEPFVSLKMKACEARREYSSEMNIILLDRTTRPSQEDVARWQRGINQILTLDEIAGRIDVVDLVDAGKLAGPPLAFCYPERLKDTSQKKESKSAVDKILAELTELRYGPKKSIKLDTNLIWEINDARKLVRETIANIPVKSPIKSTNTTAIEGPLGISISQRCRQVTNCRVLVFSDLIDSNLKQSVSRLDKSAAGQLGMERSSQIMSGTETWATKVKFQFVVWGFGRDEQGINVAAPEVLEQKLSSFWISYLTSICKRGAAGSGSAISLEPPNGLPTACF